MYGLAAEQPKAEHSNNNINNISSSKQQKAESDETNERTNEWTLIGRLVDVASQKESQKVMDRVDYSFVCVCVGCFNINNNKSSHISFSTY